MSVDERFWARVPKKNKNECWEWSGHRHRQGYGFLKVDGTSKLGHRISWEIHYSAIPVGKMVLHRCDNPPCCNPTHLFLGTQKDNMIDCSAKGRLCCGEKNVLSRLTSEVVTRIRSAKGTYREIAKLFGTASSNVSVIKNRQGWKHLT